LAKERQQQAEATRRVEEEERRVSAARKADADRPDFAVFRDAPFAPELVVIPAGQFMMGSPEREEGRYDNEGPQHRVTIGQRFAIGRYPVTFDEYDRFCEAKQPKQPADEGWGRGRRPVINISWQDAQVYIAWLSQETGRAYRLPSEAEWEYACRAGTATRYSFGDAITPENANFSDSGLGRTSEVGAYSANPWSLYDMHGNVWEWVEDDWRRTDRRIGLEGCRSRRESGLSHVPRRLLEKRFEALPFRLPRRVRRRHPALLSRVSGGPNTFLILNLDFFASWVRGNLGRFFGRATADAANQSGIVLERPIGSCYG